MQFEHERELYAPSRADTAETLGKIRRHSVEQSLQVLFRIPLVYEQ